MKIQLEVALVALVSNYIALIIFPLLNILALILYRRIFWNSLANQQMFISWYAQSILMQTISVISISDGTPTILIPLTFIIFVTAVKDFSEDYKRKQSDRQENMKKVERLQGDQFVECRWQDLRVGEIIKLNNNQYLPADILILTTSEQKGICYIETKNLDGETNMKQKNAPKELQGNEKVVPLAFEFEGPNKYLYQFQGTGYMDEKMKGILREREKLLTKVNSQQQSFQKSSQVDLERLSQLKTDIYNWQCDKISINNNNFILRGSSIRNTKYIWGLVTYTGHDTKIMKNSFKARAKKSQLEKETSIQIIFVFLTQIGICLFSAVYYSIWYYNSKDNLEYLQIDLNGTIDNSNSYNFGVRLGNWMLMFGNFVPISLLVTLEMVKFIQAILIANDDKYMTSYVTDPPTKCVVQSSNLNEELGQISYIFSDKTGTLTCNLMEFKKLCVNGISYGEARQGDPNYLEDISKLKEVTNVDFRDADFIKIVESKQGADYEAIKSVLLLLAVCHTIITENKDGEIVYNAASPDELALVNLARFVGFEYRGIDSDEVITVGVGEVEFKFQLYHTLEFDSTRKRNSVIVKDLTSNKIKILTKGADSIIFDRSDEQKNPKDKIEAYQMNLKEYGKIGLRTLLLAEKELSESAYTEWNERYKKASESMEEREKQMNDLQDEIERDLIIVGATAIEDKLQDQVGDTIHTLIEAGIKVWVLTGDKVETAINIGYSCQLLNPEMKLIVVEERDQDELVKKLEDESLFEPWHKDGYGLVVTGDALTVIFKEGNMKLQKRMIDIGEKCESVVCCRVSPAQKQEVVSVVRRYNPTVSTLAIGDGANDVSMITAAHVGIGIKGVEGQQAARASDYAVGEFKMLKSLVFVHGRESYRKNADLVLYNFFKNIVLVFPQFWMSIYNNFSGQTPYDAYIYQLYNVFFTFMPIIIYSVFDEEYSKEALYKNEQKQYMIGLNNERFSTKLFWGWFMNGAFQSACIAFSLIYTLEYVIPNSDGHNYNFWWTGTAIFGMTVVVCNNKIVLMSNNWSFAEMFFYVGSMLMYVIILIIVMLIPTSSLYDILLILISCPTLHVTNILIIGMANLIDLGIITPILESWGKKDQNIFNDKIVPMMTGSRKNIKQSQQSQIKQSQIKLQPQDQEMENLNEQVQEQEQKQRQGQE